MVNETFQNGSRGCIAMYPLSATPDEVDKARELMQAVRDDNRHLNIRCRRFPVDEKCPLYRWDTREPREIFEIGFKPRPQKSLKRHVYYNIEDFICESGPIFRGRRPYGFVSTTEDGDYVPSPGPCKAVYRYTIYAPGGIDVLKSFGSKGSKHPYISNQKEITFVGGIDPVYIKSAELYLLRQGGKKNHVQTLEKSGSSENNNFLKKRCDIAAVASTSTPTDTGEESKRKKSKRKKHDVEVAAAPTGDPSIAKREAKRKKCDNEVSSDSKTRAKRKRTRAKRKRLMRIRWFNIGHWFLLMRHGLL